MRSGLAALRVVGRGTTIVIDARVGGAARTTTGPDGCCGSAGIGVTGSAGGGLGAGSSSAAAVSVSASATASVKTRPS